MQDNSTPPRAPRPQKTAPFTVYIFYDADDNVLYVGSSQYFSTRVTQHSKKDWWKSVCRIEQAHYDNRYDALEQERQLIEQLQPRFNKNRRFKTARMSNPNLTHTNAGPSTCWCRICGHTWVPQNPSPRNCPHCRGRFWSAPPNDGSYLRRELGKQP